ncbi:hypothetical protein [Sansalvadorimonas verongulae]|uniref:hypothetical protein n=1 Tax=Sansalvadorimonas verongulae TaxID=2172824 RepID=UPI0012BBE13F|nr:hypothetical protein [Sansalvadorimonas verongulae]MTI12457.1 hypothetical protein [Sansalvadorimonas verongulae]
MRNADEAVKCLRLDAFQEGIAEYLEDVYQRHPDWGAMNRVQQCHAVQQCMYNDLDKFLNSKDTQRNFRSFYGELVLVAAYFLNSIDDPREILTAIGMSMKDVQDEDEDAFVWFQTMLDTLPCKYEMSLRNALLGELVLDRKGRLSEKELFEITKANPFVVSVLNKAIIQHLQKKAGLPDQAASSTDNPDICEVYNLESIAGATQPSPRKKGGHRKGGKRASTPDWFSPAHQARQKLNTFEVNKALKDTIAAQADTVQRKQQVYKCLEKIENCRHWDDLRLLSSGGDGWKALASEAGQPTQIYHMSAGEKGTDNTATLLFTRLGSTMEPIAIAAHTGRRSSEYQVIQSLGGWELPSRFVNLRTPFVARKVFQNVKVKM